MLSALVVLALQVASPPQAAQAAKAARDSAAVADSLAKRQAAIDTLKRRTKPPPRRVPVTPELERTAFVDAGARTMLLRAREARLRQDSLLQSYDAKTYMRMSFGMAFRAMMRDRLAARTEAAGRVRWVRGTGMHVEVTGQRSVVPIGGSKGQFVGDGASMVPIPYFPGRESLFPMSSVGVVRAEVDENNFVHPLAAGSEAYYRYESGESMTIVLPSRERITIRELRITARRAEWKLFVGSFWFDERTGQLVRAAYRLSEPLDIWDVANDEELGEVRRIEADTALLRQDPAEWKRRRDAAKKEADDVPFAVKAMFTPARLDITGITTEYELREGRFWMPRANYAEGHMVLGFLRTPFRMEEKFSYESINGVDALPDAAAAALARRDSMDAELDSLARREEEMTNVNLSIGDDLPDSADIRRRLEADTTARGRRRLARWRERERQCAETGSYTRVQSRYDGALRFPFSVPCDTTRLAASPDLPPSIYEPGEDAFDEKSRDELLKALDLGLQPPFAMAPVKPYWGLNLVRYNRVEGLSSAVGARWAPGGGWEADAQVRLGVADLEPNGELRIARSNVRTTLGLGAYRRLAAANDRGDPLSFGSSLAHFLYGRDEGFYYRTAGLELTGSHGARGTRRWRLFAEDHSTAEKETDFSLAKTFAGTDFLPNIAAREGQVLGGATVWAFTRGLDPRGFRLAGDWRVEGAFGDFDYARTSLDATLSRGLGRKVEGALTAAGGYSGGDLPAQRAWYVGGAQTVRGQLAGTQVGNAYWLGRAELARSWPIMRPVIFGDVGWAGDRDRLFDRPGRVMSGAGVGASFLDGLMRVDLSRGIRPRQMWRMDLYLEARF